MGCCLNFCLSFGCDTITTSSRSLTFEVSIATASVVLVSYFSIADTRHVNNVINMIDNYIIKIDNWCTCDTFASSLKIINKNKSRFYSYVYKKYNEALSEAWNNFKANPVKKLAKEFEVFKRENDFWLDKDSLYEALSVEHGNDYWPLWESETDKNLFNPQSNEEKIQFADRIKEIESKYSDEIELYKFIQFVISKQNEEILVSAAGISLLFGKQCTPEICDSAKDFAESLVYGT